VLSQHRNQAPAASIIPAAAVVAARPVRVRDAIGDLLAAAIAALTGRRPIAPGDTDHPAVRHAAVRPRHTVGVGHALTETSVAGARAPGGGVLF
jgi:hypothetical protein